MKNQDPNIKFIKCPGLYYTKADGSIQAVYRRTNKPISGDQNLPQEVEYKDCIVVLEVDIYIKEAQCFVCQTKFCVNCFEDHEKLTCEQYRKWKQDNDQGDELFKQYTEKMKMAKCSKCQSWVYKTKDCNHITCRCKHEFCYLCGADYKPRKCACGQFDKRNDVKE